VPLMSTTKPLLEVLKGASPQLPPIWLMRQAGRYLPEYREVRRQAKDFLALCYTPELAVEVTLQPIRRFGFDAAIIFSDILVVPHALGQAVSFVESVGPVLETVRDKESLQRLKPAGVVERLSPVYTAIEMVRAALPERTALIGFAGAPWTVATYMVEGGTSRDHALTKRWAFQDPDGFGQLIDMVVNATADHLIAQVAAGAEVLQLFDTWAGVLPEHEMRRWCLAPVETIMARVRDVYPDVPFIVFPRGIGVGYGSYAAASSCQALSLDSTVSLAWAARTIQSRKPVQGNLDPQLLVVGGEPMREAVHRLLQVFGQSPFIFNLGHGVVPDTPPQNVAELIHIVRSGRI
jgi:uroporphyrinogen decarboxylase